MRVAAGHDLLAVGAREHRVDRRAHQLDVAVFLGGDVGDQVVERPQAVAIAEVERLERVVHERGHLPEAPAHQLLHRHRAGGVRVSRRDLDAQPVITQDHASLLFVRSAVGTCPNLWERERELTGAVRALTAGIRVPYYARAGYRARRNQRIRRSGRMETGHGASVRRLEDPAMVRGARPYTDDMPAPGALYAVFVRSLFAHARITSIDTSAAGEAPGVVAVHTAADFELAPLEAGSVPEQMRRPVIARDTVRFVGELLAVVVAETRGQAVDAAELVDVEYDALDALIDPEKALERDAPVLFPDAEKGNLAAEGTAGAEGALDGAEVVVGGRFVNQRVAAVPMEPGAVLAMPDPDRPGALRVWTPSQGAHAHRDAIAASLGIDPGELRVITPATGGGFGARIPVQPEAIVVAALARRLERPVRYIETRSETFTTMRHGRAQLQDVQIGGTRDGRVTGLKVRVIADCGAYPADST